MKIVGMTKEGEIKEIEISKCPLLLDKDLVGYYNQLNSPLWEVSSIVRYDEELDIMEGDWLLDSEGKEIGIIFYDRGFRVQEKDGTSKILPSYQHILMDKKRCRSSLYNAVNVCTRQQVKYCVGTKKVSLSDFVLSSDNNIAIINIQGSIDPSKVYIYTGIDELDVPLYFGKTYKGGRIVFYDSEVYIEYQSGEKKKILQE